MGAADLNERIRITISICPRDISRLESRIYDISNHLPIERQYITIDELERLHGASPQHLTQIKRFAQSHDLEVIEANALKRTVILEGTVASLKSTFGAKLKCYKYHGSNYYGRTGWIRVSKKIKPIVQGVHGLDNRPQFTPSFSQSKGNSTMLKDHRHPYTPLEIANLYNFPTTDAKGARLDGSGQCIGIIELGGGFYTDEIDTYFQHLGITSPPHISSVFIGDGKNNPGIDQEADGEVMMDISITGAIAPGAKIVVYFSNGTTKGFFDAVTHAVHDSQHNPSIISISWGGAEGKEWGQLMDAMNHAFLDAAALGITICGTTGDHGSSDLRPYKEVITDNFTHVEFPASSPFVLACGGTKLVSSDDGVITNEIVWNDGKDGATGGGVSEYFNRPDYQIGINIPVSMNKKLIDGRGVPDVSGIASPGYNIPVHGKEEPKGRGGTSVVAPLWAGLIALINQSIGKRIGFINPLLYKHPAFIGILRDITKGNNALRNMKLAQNGKLNVKGYKARKGWDACTGFGSPDGVKLLNALK